MGRSDFAALLPSILTDQAYVIETLAPIGVPLTYQESLRLVYISTTIACHAFSNPSLCGLTWLSTDGCYLAATMLRVMPAYVVTYFKKQVGFVKLHSIITAYIKMH